MKNLVIAALAALAVLLVSQPAIAQCANGTCRAPLALDTAAACTPESCPAGGACAGACVGGCACASTAAHHVIRSTYQAMPPRWRPVRRFFARFR